MVDREVPEWARSMVYIARCLRIYEIEPLRGNNGVVVFCLHPEREQPEILCVASGWCELETIVRHCAVWMGCVHNVVHPSKTYQGSVAADRVFAQDRGWEERAAEIVAEVGRFGSQFYDTQQLAALNIKAER